MRIGQYYGDTPRSYIPFVESNGHRVPANRLPSLQSVTGMNDLIAQWGQLQSAIEQDLGDLDAGAVQPEADGLRLAPPCDPAARVFGVGFNYQDHAREFGLDLPDTPLIFTIMRSALVGDGEDIEIRPDLTSEVDWEAELGVVVGRRMSSVEPNDVREAIFGYTICNDVTARDLQRIDGQWVRAKGLERSHPVGPVIVTAEDVPDPESLAISSYLNGQAMQRSSTTEFIFGVDEIVSFLSQAITLEPGDLVMTGTPAGVGAFRTPPIFLTHGDTVAIEIETIGALENRCTHVGIDLT